MISKKNSYLLTIRLEIAAVDDPAAREQAMNLEQQLNLPAGAKIKLQRLERKQAPVRVQCDFKSIEEKMSSLYLPKENK